MHAHFHTATTTNEESERERKKFNLVRAMLVYLLLVLLAFPLKQAIEIDIVHSGQRRFSSRAIGTVLYVDLFHAVEHSIYLSAVVERCCRANAQCQPVRLLGGDFGQIPPKTNRSIAFLWPALLWSDVHEPIFCEVSMFFGFRSSPTHHQLVTVPIRSMPVGMDFRSPIESRLQIPNAPFVTYRRCDEYLNLAKNQCETLDHLRQRLPPPTSVSHLVPVHDHAPRYLSNRSRFHQLIIVTVLLCVLYVVLLFISCLFICSAARDHHAEEDSIRSAESKFWSDEQFSLIECSIDED